MPLTSKGHKVLAKLREQYGQKRGEHVLYALKNSGKLDGIDAAFSYAEAREAERAGHGLPLVPELIHTTIRDATARGLSARDALKEAVDRRLSFQGSQDERRPDHECSPENCYPGCGHDCQHSRTRDELFAAQPGGKTQRFLMGDRVHAVDALVNRLRGRRLGNRKNPLQRDGLLTEAQVRRASQEDQLMSSTESMEQGAMEDGAAFEHVERSVAAKGAHDPAALAAWIGRRAEGKKSFQAKAAAGRGDASS